MNVKNKNSGNIFETGVSILNNLRRISRVVELNSKKLSSESNLTSPQVLALLSVYENGPLTIARIADEIHLSASTLVGVIDRLESKGLLLRERSTSDRRQVLVKITEEGKKIAKKSPAPLQNQLISSLERLSDGQQKSLVKSLDLLVDMLAEDDTNSEVLSGEIAD